MRTFFSCFHAISALFFYLAAYVQLNDPDAEVWVTFYLFPAILSSILMFNPLRKNSTLFQSFNSILQVVCGGFVIYLTTKLWQQFSRNNELRLDKTIDFFLNILHFECGRELGGVILVLMWSKSHKLNSWKPYRFLLVIACLPLVLWASCYVDWAGRKFSFCRAMCAPGPSSD